MTRKDPTARKTPSTTKRMILMLIAVTVIFGGVFAVKAIMSKGMNDFFDTMPQPAAAVTDWTAKQEEWIDAQQAVGTFVAINGTDVTTEAGGGVSQWRGRAVQLGQRALQLAHFGFGGCQLVRIDRLARRQRRGRRHRLRCGGGHLLLGALRGQGLPAFEAACLGVWLHASAGEQLAQQGRGLAASELLPAIRQLLEEVSPCLS